MYQVYSDELYHHGILGQKWGVRRYQNEDGSLTPLGQRRRDRKDTRWANRNYDRIYAKTYKKSKKEIQSYVKNELNKNYSSVGKNYINAYNKKLAELMNKNVGDVRAPSGKIVQFVAKRGSVGVHLALADEGYNMNQLKNGVWEGGRIAYRKDKVNTT